MKKTSRTALLIILLLIILALWSCQSLGSRQASTRVLIIAVDGLEWSILNRGIAENRLPTFSKMINEGCATKLHTLYPTLSPNIWTSIATGKPPETHGVIFKVTKALEFSPAAKQKTLTPAEARGPSPKLRVNNFFFSQSRKVRAFWNILTELHIPSIVVGWMVSDPIEKIEGVQVGFALSTENKPAIFPARDVRYVEAAQRDAEGAEYGIFNERVLNYLKNGNTKERSLFHVLKKNAEKDSLFFHLCRGLIANERWRVAAVYLRLVDVTQHLFFQYLPEIAESSLPEPTGSFNTVIPDAYRFMDRQIAKLLQLIDSQTMVMILSDHGFRSIRNHPFLIDIAPIIEAMNETADHDSMPGVLSSEPGSLPDDHRMLKLVLPAPSPSHHAKALHYWQTLLSKVRLKGSNSPLLSIETLQPLPRGQGYLIRTLLNPSLTVNSVIYLADNNWHTESLLKDVQLTPYQFSGVHLAKPDGVFIAWGKNVRKHFTPKPLHVYDVLPTMFCALGLHTARDLSGSARVDIFSIPVRMPPPISTYETSRYSPVPAFTPLPVQIGQDQINELQALGYLSNE